MFWVGKLDKWTGTLLTADPCEPMEVLAFIRDFLGPFKMNEHAVVLTEEEYENWEDPVQETEDYGVLPGIDFPATLCRRA